jgi:hypothetical protein
VKTQVILLLSLLWTALPAQQTNSDEPRYTGNGQLMRPGSYRDWVYLSSGLGMTYGVETGAKPTSERFDNVFVTPKAYKAFMQTGTWPDKTMFALEVRDSATHGSINQGGHYQEGIAALEIHLKDQKRFAGGWAFFGFGRADQTGKAFPADSACQTCHAKSGAVDETFVQFYPTLIPIAKAKGTFQAGTVK